MATTRLLTIEDVEQSPPEGEWELIDGELIELTPTADTSGWVSGRVFSRLERFVDDRHLGWAFPPETGFVLFNDRATVRSPDAAFVRSDRLRTLSGGFVPLAPDLAVEVLSPSDRLADALAKVKMYLDAGVLLVWLVDPLSQTVTIFRPNATPTKLGVGDTLDGGDVLPGFTVPVAEIFG